MEVIHLCENNSKYRVPKSAKYLKPNLHECRESAKPPEGIYKVLKHTNH